MIWFVLIFAFLIIEALSFNLITIWFAFGSLCAFISTYFTDNLIIQIVVFTFFTIISLIDSFNVSVLTVTKLLLIPLTVKTF